MNEKNRENNTESKEREITDDIGTANAGASAISNKIMENIKDLPKVTKIVTPIHHKVIDGMLLTHSLSTAQEEKEKFAEAYKFGVSSATATEGAATGSYFGNEGGEAFAEATSDSVYSIKEAFLNTSYLTLTINTTSSPSVSFLITKAHIKESLESLFCIECEGYIESLQEHPFALDSFDSIKNNSNIASATNNSSSVNITCIIRGKQ